MKKKLALLFTLVMLMIMVAPTLAYGSVRGEIIDSKDLDPWQHGAEIWVYNTVTGDICATIRLNPGTSSFNVSLDGTVDDLGGGSVDCRTGMSGQTIEILVDYTCAVFGGCTAPAGTPATGTIQFTQNGISILPYNAGFIKTGTGPTAISLQGFGGSSASLPLVAGLMVVLMAGVTFVAIRRRNA
ncbi:MAG: hypothetical protein KC425_09765 [Anaerolineales bacterium]|nr:hypothetical protein [Anaerolineales bacterium]